MSNVQTSHICKAGAYCVCKGSKTLVLSSDYADKIVKWFTDHQLLQHDLTNHMPSFKLVKDNLYIYFPPIQSYEQQVNNFCFPVIHIIFLLYN